MQYHTPHGNTIKTRREHNSATSAQLINRPPPNRPMGGGRQGRNPAPGGGGHPPGAATKAALPQSDAPEGRHDHDPELCTGRRASPKRPTITRGGGVARGGWRRRRVTRRTHAPEGSTAMDKGEGETEPGTGRGSRRPAGAHPRARAAGRAAKGRAARRGYTPRCR